MGERSSVVFKETQPIFRHTGRIFGEIPKFCGLSSRPVPNCHWSGIGKSIKTIFGWTGEPLDDPAKAFNLRCRIYRQRPWDFQNFNRRNELKTLGMDARGSDESVCFQHVSTSLMKLICIKATFWDLMTPVETKLSSAFFFAVPIRYCRNWWNSTNVMATLLSYTFPTSLGLPFIYMVHDFHILSW